jgi:hypothetical protein
MVLQLDPLWFASPRPEFSVVCGHYRRLPKRGHRNPTDLWCLGSRMSPTHVNLFDDIHDPKPYECIGRRWALTSQAPVFWVVQWCSKPAPPKIGSGRLARGPGEEIQHLEVRPWMLQGYHVAADPLLDLLGMSAPKFFKSGCCFAAGLI